MADICVIHASDDKEIVEKLVKLLKKNWTVWWDGDLYQGNWEKKVRSEMQISKAIVPVFSTNTSKKDIFPDELEYAKEKGLLIFPFVISKTEIPFGFNKLNRTEAFGWKGEDTNPGFLELQYKLMHEIEITKEISDSLKRMLILYLNGKILKLPNFVFSLSTFETQITPEAGIKLLNLFCPNAGLVSAYDCWNHYKNEISFLNDIKSLKLTKCTLFLDSGNYEAYRKNDKTSCSNKEGWKKEYFYEVANNIVPDVAFSFDNPEPQGTIEEIAAEIIKSYIIDRDEIDKSIHVCPIVHIPKKLTMLKEILPYVCEIITKVAYELDPFMISIPERELGSGLIERFRTVCAIRNSLNKLGKYYPLHLLGTGNPISMNAFAVAGADSFDGLEWCRVVADYKNSYLFHYQHFDCFAKSCLQNLKSKLIRSIVEDEKNPYLVRVSSYNIDFFNDCIQTIQDLAEVGKEIYLLKSIPNIGDLLEENFRNEV